MNIYAVSKVELDEDGRVTRVYWGRVNTRENDWATHEVLASVDAVVDALHAGDRIFALFPSTHGHMPEREFAIVEYDDGRKAIALAGPATHEREIHDMDRIST